MSIPIFLEAQQQGARVLTERCRTVDPIRAREESLGEGNSLEHGTSFSQRVLLFLYVVHPLLPPNLRRCP